jgi:hypothetical protein
LWTAVRVAILVRISFKQRWDSESNIKLGTMVVEIFARMV